MASRANEWFPVFFVVWAALGIGGAIFFYGGEHVALKRRLHPWYIALVSLLFLGFTSFIQGRVPIFMVVVVGIIAWTNIRLTRFCDSCGRMMMSRNLTGAPTFCQGCGARLDGTGPA